MEYQGIRSGEFAVLQGRAYPCSYDARTESALLKTRDRENPNPELYAWHERYGGWVADLGSDRCERLYHVVTYARYCDRRVGLRSISEAMAEVFYADRDGSWAERSGFVQVNKYEFETIVPITDLTDLHEDQRDLTFESWRALSFVPPAGIVRAGRVPGASETSVAPLAPPAPSHAQVKRPRAGTFATVLGREYRAERRPNSAMVWIFDTAIENPEPALLVGEPGCWSAHLLAADCERLAEVTAVADYRGHECQIMEMGTDGTVTLQLVSLDMNQVGPELRRLDEDGAASALGFSPTAPGRWRRQANVYEIARLRERHVDLLFAEWVAAGMPTLPVGPVA